MKIAVIGAGLIGGSLALCFRGKPEIELVGYSHRQDLADLSVQLGVVDSATLSLEEAAADADFIFLSTPVGLLETYLEKINALPLKNGCIVTDVGSTKASIAARARELDWGKACFIGGHPMAGSERSGVQAATSLLFENAYYVLTPPPETDPDAIDALTRLLALTRAKVICMEPDQHDEIVGAISHLPHIIAVALVNQISGYDENNSLYRTLAAGGFRDITRIASSDPVVWRDILLNNRFILLKLLRDWNSQVEGFIGQLEREDGEGIARRFHDAGEFRSELPERRKGAIARTYDLYLDVPDHPGIIGRITTELGSRGINLSNLQIIESREDVPGLMRLSFRDGVHMERAREALGSLEFTVYT
ncbi:prephenate dehydrogenase [Saccharibacillus sp. CPCC 101409]|uniref:prephenate dehydrogenase n=1 Tax=Saccharibacillus sp. CPCC 101409 TaxID=3058041 RepID=UPI002672B7A2|nr:prephenate dehydrogenase [Saccharibacillus sp. CPCC 101409]MDO3409618.1 prephenate dehydrogenase [Saccharibacillus sp. CPCC 101409]